MPDGNLATLVELICQIGDIRGLTPDQDFYDAGFSSVNVLPLLMEVEDRFQVSIPDERFISARTARGLQEVIAGLKES